MNIDATTEELQNAAEALKLAAILDDRAPRADKARIAAWAEKLHKFTLSRADVLDGLQAFYDSPSERAIQIGDLLHHARIVKRARLEKEEDAEREARQSENDVKSADEMRSLMADAIVGRIERETPRVSAARDALQDCFGKDDSREALREYIAAWAEVSKSRRPVRRAS